MRYRIKVHERLLVVEDTEAGHSRTESGQLQRGKRAAVQGLSSLSRLRLTRFLATIGRVDSCFFVTLTYWRWRDNWEEWKRDLDAFIKALRYFDSSACGVWRLEFQERGAPHYHLLLWFDAVHDEHEVADLVRDAWLRIIAQDTPETRAHGTEVGYVDDLRRSVFYLSIYQSKDKNDRKDIRTGRLWGVFGRDRLQCQPIRELQLGDAEQVLLRRLVRRLYRATHRTTFRASLYYRNLRSADCGFSSFGAFPHWYRILSYVTGASICRKESTEVEVPF